MADNRGLWRVEQAPIHVSVPNSATVFDTLAAVLGTYHAVPDLVNAFFSLHLATESQHQFAFMWEEQQWTFQVLPQGHLHSPTTCHGMVAQDLSLFSFPTSVKWAHYIDEMMLTCEDLPLLQDLLQTLLEHL